MASKQTGRGPGRSKSTPSIAASAPAAVVERPENTPVETILPEASHPLPERDKFRPNDRISLKITEGKFDVTTVRESNEARLRESFKLSFSDPEFRKWAGLEGVPVTAQEIEELFSPEQMGSILDVLSKVEVVFASSATGLTSDECNGFLSFDEVEHRILDKQGARLICRYLPAEWLKKADLWLFLLSFISITAAKFKRLNEHARLVVRKTKEAVDSAEITPSRSEGAS